MPYKRAEVCCKPTSDVHKTKRTDLDDLFFMLMYRYGPVHQRQQDAHLPGLDHLSCYLVRELLARLPEIVGIQPPQRLLQDEVRNRVYGEARELALEIRCPEDGKDGGRGASDECLEEM